MDDKACRKAAELAAALNRIRARGARVSAKKILQRASCEEISWYHRKLVEDNRKT